MWCQAWPLLSYSYHNQNIAGQKEVSPRRTNSISDDSCWVIFLSFTQTGEGLVDIQAESPPFLFRMRPNLLDNGDKNEVTRVE